MYATFVHSINADSFQFIAFELQKLILKFSPSEFDPTTVSVNSFSCTSIRDSPPITSSPTLCCAVCGDVSSGKHYGSLELNIKIRYVSRLLKTQFFQMNLMIR